MNETKKCTKCRLEKDLGEFKTYTKGGKVYCRPRCNECLREDARAYYYRNIEKVLKNRKKRYYKNKEKSKAIANKIIKSGEKECDGCHKIKFLEDFGISLRMSDGRIFWHKKCKECRGYFKEETEKKCKGPCGLTKPLKKFGTFKRKDGSVGYRGTCIQCYTQNKEDKSKYNKKYREKNKDKINKQQKTYYKKNKDKILAYQKIYREENKDKILAHQKVYSENNKDKINEYHIKYRKENMPKIVQKNKYRMANNIQYRMMCYLRNRINKAIKKGQKAGSAVQDLGCSIEELKMSLESQFYSHPKTGEEMTWENYGRYGWHIDHILPLSFFNLTDREEFLVACHWSNLAPMWADENLGKGGINRK